MADNTQLTLSPSLLPRAPPPSRVTSPPPYYLMGSGPDDDTYSIISLDADVAIFNNKLVKCLGAVAGAKYEPVYYATRERSTSSVSMSAVPASMSAGQLLPPKEADNEQSDIKEPGILGRGIDKAGEIVDNWISIVGPSIIRPSSARSMELAMRKPVNLEVFPSYDEEHAMHLIEHPLPPYTIRIRGYPDHPALEDDFVMVEQQSMPAPTPLPLGGSIFSTLMAKFRFYGESYQEIFSDLDDDQPLLSNQQQQPKSNASARPAPHYPSQWPEKQRFFF